MSHQYLPSTYFDWPARPHGLYLHDGVYNEYIEYDYYAGDEIHINNVAFRNSSYVSFDDTHTRWLNKTDIHMYDTSSVKIFDSGTLTMHTSSSPFSRSFVVDNHGRVGIGMVHEEPHSNTVESPSFDLDVRGSVGIEDYLYHNDDKDTYMLFGADEVMHFTNINGSPDISTTTDFDEINFRVGGVDMLQMVEDDTQDSIVFNKRQSDVDLTIKTATNTRAVVVSGDGSEVVINDDGNSDTDFRVESDKSDKMLLVDSSNDAMYLHGPADDSDIFVVYGNGNDGLSGHNIFKINPTEITFNASSNDIDFRIAADNADSSQNTTDVGTDGNSVTHLTHNPGYAFFLNSNNGRVGLGTNAPDTTLHIAGSAHIEGDLWVKGNVNQVDTFVHMTSAVDITNKGTGPALTVNQTGIHPVVSFKDDGSDVFYIEDGGNVGFQTGNPHTSIYVNDHDGIRIPVGDSSQRPLSGDFLITGDPANADFSAMYGTIRYNNEFQTFEGFGPGDAWGSLGGVIDIDRDTFWTALNDISGSDYPGDPDTLRAYVGNDGDPTKTTGLLMMTISANKTIIHNPDVGIGTTDPQGELHIKGGSENNEPVKLVLQGPSQTASAAFPQPMGMIGFTSNENAIADGVIDVAGIRAEATKDFNASSYGSDLSFYTTNNGAGSSTGKMWIKNNGRVGIGTSTPERELTLRGIFRWGEASHYTYSGQDTGGLWIEQVDNNTNRAKIRLQTRPNSTGSYSVFRIDADDRFFKFDNGDVGVGITPSNKLDVLTNETHYAGYFKNNHSTSGGGILSWMPNAADTRFVAYLEGNSTHRGLYVKGDGKTGIGTTNPTATLHIKPRLGSGANYTTNSPLYIDSPANTVSMFVGTNTDTAGFGANSYSGNIRFNGSNQAWGDFGYYPTGGDDGEYGEFRFSTAGSNVNTSPNAKVGVGSLFVNNNVGIATSAPRARLEIQENQNTSRTTYSGAVDKAGLLISTNYTADAFTPGIFWQTDNNNPTKPKGGVFMSTHGSGSRLHLGTSENYSTGINRYVTINERGNMTIGALDNTVSAGAALDIRGWDGETTMLRIGKSMDGAQGTGAVEVTQDGDHGGGMFYNGDGSPGFVTGETADWLSFYRLAGGVRTEVFGYSYNNSDVYFNADIYTPNAIRHTGDADTYTQFHAENQWRVVTGGSERLEVSNSETKVSNTLAIGDIKLKESADRADLLEITSTTGGWGGIQIRNSANEGRWSFMTDGEYAGIYNDEDNQWHLHMQEGGYTRLYYASSERLTTTSGGVDFHDRDLQSVKDIYVGATIFHDGDTNTYTQFEEADKWRVVTGGSTRFRIDNSNVNSYNNINVAKTFPKLILNSPSDGDGWTSQGAMIGLGESANMDGSGTAALYMTYNGNGTSYIGTGGVSTSTGVPNKGYIKFTYNSNALYFSANPSIAGSTNWHSGNDGASSGLDADKLDGQHASSFLRSNASDTFSGDLTSSGSARIILKKTDNNVSDHIQFFNGTTRMGEIGCEDTTWLRINQETAKNIYTPRYIRADAGFYVDGTTKGINGSGNFIGGTISGASDVSVSAGNNTVVRRHSSGYIYANYFNTNHSTSTRSSDTIFYSSTDTFIRKNDATGMRNSLNVPTRTGGSASGTWPINITGTADWADRVDVNISDTGNNEYRLLWHSSDTVYSSNHFKIHRNNKTISCAGDIIAFASDERLKENITLIDKPLEKLAKISGYNFNFTEKGAEVTGQSQDTKQIGVLAQEVEQVCPEVIAPAPGDKDYKTVKYDKLVPLLIESIKAQQEQIDALKSEIEQLKR